MARTTTLRRTKSAADAAPFLDLLDRMETLVKTIDIDWPEQITQDARRRLTRLERALRHAPETRERL
jgi:hypothetical protein